MVSDSTCFPKTSRGKWGCDTSQSWGSEGTVLFSRHGGTVVVETRFMFSSRWMSQMMSGQE